MQDQQDKDRNPVMLELVLLELQEQLAMAELEVLAELAEQVVQLVQLDLMVQLEVLEVLETLAVLVAENNAVKAPNVELLLEIKIVAKLVIIVSPHTKIFMPKLNPQFVEEVVLLEELGLQIKVQAV